jgi:hypothetical protein
MNITVMKFSKEFVENCSPVKSVELLPISDPTLKDITNITGFKRS